MLTLIFGQLIYESANKFISLTGGTDGIAGIPRSTFLFINMDSDINYYYLTLILIIACYLVARMLVSSPFGQVLKAMRLNGQRTDLLGFRTQRFRLLVFTISGLYAGLAGGLISPFLSHTAPNLSHWSVGGDIMMMTLVGGKGTLIGPVLGSGFIFMLKDIIGSHTQYWMIILGVIFVLFVILAPNGIMGIWRLTMVKIKKIIFKKDMV